MNIKYINYILVILLSGLLVVSGADCSSKKKVDTSATFIGGNQGLELSFVQDMPPETNNYQNEQFPISVLLKNKGEYPVKKDTVVVKIIKTFTDKNFKLTKPKSSTIHDLLPASKGLNNEIDYDDAIVDLGYATYTAQTMSPDYKPDLSVEACYPYKTMFKLDKFCIPSTSRATEDQTCLIDQTKNLVTANSNSGAPVQITSIRQEIVQNAVRITLEISKLGDGKVIECVENPESKDKNKITVHINSPTDINCGFTEGSGNSGIVILKSDNTAKLICETSHN